MSRLRREIYSGQVYEICMRTRQGLPFVCRQYMKMLLESVMARVQRDSKVILCHYLWMANHPHMLIIAQDKKSCTQFYGEIQKQLTEAVKRLCGLRHLNLWKNNATSLIPYHDIETVSYRVAYFYANPARAHLVDSILEYPGASSWNEFIKDKFSLNASHSKECPWIRAPFIEQLSQPAISRAEEHGIVSEWGQKAKDSHELTVYPNAWMSSFGVKTREEVEEINKKIVKYLTGLEEEARQERKGRKPMGRKKLISQPLNLTYEPKKPSRRIFAYSLDPKLRAYLIEKYHEFCDRCRECYERWKLGDFTVEWPPGALLPPPPHSKNDFSPQISNVY